MNILIVSDAWHPQINGVVRTLDTIIKELQALGIAVQGNPRLLFNMIRLSSGGLLALGQEEAMEQPVRA